MTQKVLPNYAKVVRLIKSLCYLHNEFSLLWEKNEELINLTKRVDKVTDVSEEQSTFTVDEKFLRLLTGYTDELVELSLELTISDALRYTYDEYDLRFRVKQPDSVIFKLKYYRVGKDQKGAVPLKKCLNDLMGFRITIDDFNHNCNEFENTFNNFQKEIESSPYRIKKQYSARGGYKATHVYLHGEKNKFFPWELQIWSKQDEKLNLQSHKEHKQEYVKWAGIYRDSQEISKKEG